MRKEELEKWVERQEKVAESNYQAFQETGNPRYFGEQKRREDAAEIGRQALSCVEDHEKMIEYKLAIMRYASDAAQLVDNWDDQRARTLLREIVTDAAAYGITRR